MKINLNEEELKEAVRLYVAGEGIDLTGRRVDVQFSSGRNPVTYSAEVDIVRDTASQDSSAGAEQEGAADEAEDANEDQPEPVFGFGDI